MWVDRIHAVERDDIANLKQCGGRGGPAVRHQGSAGLARAVDHARSGISTGGLECGVLVLVNLEVREVGQKALQRRLGDRLDVKPDQRVVHRPIGCRAKHQLATVLRHRAFVHPLADLGQVRIVVRDRARRADLVVDLWHQRHHVGIDAVRDHCGSGFQVALGELADDQGQVLQRELERDLQLVGDRDRGRRFDNVLDLQAGPAGQNETIRLADRDGGADALELVFELAVYHTAHHEVVFQHGQGFIGNDGRRKELVSHLGADPSIGTAASHDGASPCPRAVGR